MTIAGGVIPKISTDTITEEITIFEAQENTKITYFQFVSSVNEPITLAIYLINKFGQIRLIPIGTIIESDDVLQFNVNYDLEIGDRIVAVTSVNNAINYIMTGEII